MIELEGKTKGSVEYRGISVAGHTITIEKIKGGFTIRSYRIETREISDPDIPLTWEEAHKLFTAIAQKKE